MRNKMMALAAAAFLCVSGPAFALNTQGGPGNTQHVKPPQSHVQTSGSSSNNGANPGCGTRGVPHTR